MSDFKPKDGLLFIDEKNKELDVTFNYYTWIELLKGIMVKYGKLSVEEANHIAITNQLILTSADNYSEAIMTAHESEYHWAMSIAQGDGYWTRGFSLKPEGYDEWEEQYIKENNLAESSFDFHRRKEQMALPKSW